MISYQLAIIFTKTGFTSEVATKIMQIKQKQIRQKANIAHLGGIPRTSLNIRRLSWENLARQSRNSQSELNGTTKLTLDSIS